MKLAIVSKDKLRWQISTLCHSGITPRTENELSAAAIIDRRDGMSASFNTFPPTFTPLSRADGSSRTRGRRKKSPSEYL